MTDTNRFDTDTAVVPAGDGTYEGRIDRGWWVQRGPNGGYVAALMLRALSLAMGDPARAARSLTIHYLAPPDEGAVQVHPTVERAGRSLTSVSGRLLQNGRLLGLALAAFATPRPGLSFSDAVIPEVPPPEACPPPPPNPMSIPMRDRYESRPALGGDPFSGSHEAMSGGWIRLAEPRLLDELALAAFTDAWMPSIFSRVTEEEPFSIPTVDLTVHFRSPPDPGDEWVLAVFRSRVAAEGFLEEDGELWSRDGVLLAQSRQLAAVTRVPPGAG